MSGVVEELGIKRERDLLKSTSGESGRSRGVKLEEGIKLREEE